MASILIASNRPTIITTSFKGLFETKKLNFDFTLNTGIVINCTDSEF